MNSATTTPATTTATTTTMKKRIVKKTADETVAPVEIAAAVATAAIDAPVEDASTAAATQPKKRGPKKATAPATAAAVTETVVEPESIAVATPAVATPVPTAPEMPTATDITGTTAATTAIPKPTVVEDIHTNLTRLIKIRDEANASIACLKALIVKHNREVKDARKRKNKKKLTENSDGTIAGAEEVAKRPCVFNIPRKVSESLYTFLGVSNTTDIAPTEVITRIKAYIYENKLWGEKKSILKPDAVLATLLGLEADSTTSWPAIQKILYHTHYGYEQH